MNESINNISQDELLKPYSPDDMIELLSELERTSLKLKGFSISKMVIDAFKCKPITLPNIDNLTSSLFKTVTRMGNSITYMQKDIVRLNAELEQLKGASNGD